MSRAATSRLKVNPPNGSKPLLRWLRPDEIGVDYAYQRSLDAGASQSLIRRIAQFADGERFILMTEMVRGAAQQEWYRDVSGKTADLPTRRDAAAAVFRDAWAECAAELDEAA